MNLDLWELCKLKKLLFTDIENAEFDEMEYRLSNEKKLLDKIEAEENSQIEEIKEEEIHSLVKDKEGKVLSSLEPSSPSYELQGGNNGKIN